MTNNKNIVWVLVLGLVLILGLAGYFWWGGQNPFEKSNKIADNSPFENIAEQREYVITASNGEMNPKEIIVKKGDITINFVSMDEPHNFVIDGLGVRIAESLPGLDNYVGLTLSEAGRYEYYCDKEGHDGAMERGVLIVE